MQNRMHSFTDLNSKDDYCTGNSQAGKQGFQGAVRDTRDEETTPSLEAPYLRRLRASCNLPVICSINWNYWTRRSLDCLSRPLTVVGRQEWQSGALLASAGRRSTNDLTGMHPMSRPHLDSQQTVNFSHQTSSYTGCMKCKGGFRHVRPLSCRSAIFHTSAGHVAPQGRRGQLASFDEVVL